MSAVTRSELLPGVFLTLVPATKFKSSLLSMSLLAPLRQETAAVNALIPYLLRRGSETHPDLQSISTALDLLYGGAVDPVVRQKGETQCVGFVGSFLDDSFAEEGEEVFPQAAELMAELLLRPHTEDGVFSSDYTRQEKANHIDRIRSEINEKRQYANQRVVEEMCAGEPYGLSRLGREKEVEAITPRSAWEQYQELLAHSRLELYYCGSMEPQRVRDILKSVLANLPRKGGYQVEETIIVPCAQAPKQIEERLDVAQGKLTMGFRTGGITAASTEYPALILCNALFGGTTTSKLFLHVREKLSLCYYAGSSVHRYKGIMIVSSGVEFSNMERAEKEIMTQLELCKKGQFESWEVDGARQYAVSSLWIIADSQGRQEDWWLGQAVAGLTQSPEELAGAVEAVTVEQAIAAAQKLSLDAIYFLKGKAV